MSTYRPNGSSRNGKGRLRRSRSLARTEERVDQRTDRALDSERARSGGSKRYRREPTSRVPPCVDCGNNQREWRRFVKAVWAWAPFCLRCWRKRGKPDLATSIALAEAKRAVDADAREVERKRRVDAGEAPW